MGKRGAEDQLTKDDVIELDDEVEELNRDATPEALAGRKIRGMPKRKPAASLIASGLLGPTAGTAAPSSTPAFSFGTPATAAVTTATPFSFGNTSVPTSTPIATAPSVFAGFGAKPPVSVADPPAKSPFAAFSFGSKPADTPIMADARAALALSSSTTSAQPTISATSAPKPSPFSGFSFGVAKTAPTAVSALPAASTSASSIYPSIPEATVIPARKPVEPSADITSSIPLAPKKSFSDPVALVDSKTQKETEYLLSVRGLNTSLIRALEIKLKEDPFVDLGERLIRLGQEYQVHLDEINKKAGKPVKPAKIDDSMEVEESKKQAPTSVTPSLAPPKAGTFKLPPASSTPVAGGFKPSVAVPGFSFGGKKVTPDSKPASEANGFAFKPTEKAEIKGSSFTPTTTTSAVSTILPQPTTELAKPSSTTASMIQDLIKQPESTSAPPATPAAKTPAFTFGSTTPAVPPPPSLTKKPSAIFAIKPDVRKSVSGGTSSLIVPSPASPANPTPFVFKASTDSTTSAKPASSTPGFTFAPIPKRNVSTGFTFGKPAETGEKPASQPPAFSFGSTSTAPTSNSIFSFGNSNTSGNGPATSNPAFSFASANAPTPPSASITPAFTESGSNGETNEEEGTQTPGPSMTLSSVAGAGEENEETLFEIKGQVGELKKNAEGKMAWGDWRICQIRLKREKTQEGEEDGSRMRRFLMRIDPSGNIYQNFSLRGLQSVTPLGPSGYQLAVAGVEGLKHIGIRFGKKKDGFDPEPVMQKFKETINAERRAMNLSEL